MTHRMVRTRGTKSVVVAALWMVGISLALFFLPLINGIVGGLVGGYKAGDWKRGLLAALIPAAVVAALLWLLFIAFDAPVFGLVAGATVGALVVLADIGLLAGAIVGGAWAQQQPRQPLHV